MPFEFFDDRKKGLQFDPQNFKKRVIPSWLAKTTQIICGIAGVVNGNLNTKLEQSRWSQRNVK